MTEAPSAVAIPPAALDLGHDLLGGRRALGLPALEADAEVVDDDGGPVAGELEAVLAPEAPPRAGDDHTLPSRNPIGVSASLSWRALPVAGYSVQ